MKVATQRAVLKLLAYLDEQQREGATEIHLGALYIHELDNWTVGEEIAQLTRFVREGK